MTMMVDCGRDDDDDNEVAYYSVQDRLHIYINFAVFNMMGGLHTSLLKNPGGS